MNRVRITRESLLDGTLHATTRAQQPGVKYMTDEERAQSIRGILESAPRRDRVWVFGYGSLIWNPAFHFAERRTARIHGFHRQYCLWSRTGRGSPDRPGLMLALDRGGACHGVAYRLGEAQVESELDVIWRREMGSRAYRAVWVSAHTPEGIEHAVAFVANRGHERYVRGLSVEETVRLLCQGAGPLGTCCEYLFDTVAHLRELGLRDSRLETLERRVRAHLAAA